MALVAVMSAGGGYFVAMMLDRPTAAPSQAVSIDGRQSGDLVGSRRPDFSLTDLDGAPVAASDFDGSVWLLNFWASWCAPCVDSPICRTPYLQAMDKSGFFILESRAEVDQ